MSETHRAIEAVFRIEQARLIAGLARAANLARNVRERKLLLDRAAAAGR